MDHTLFVNSFRNRTLCFRQCRHTDNSAGIACHFIGYMRRGSGVIRTLAGEELRVEAGDAFYLPMGLCYHSYWTPDVSGAVEWNSFGFVYIPTQGEGQRTMQRITLSTEGLALVERLAAQPRVSPLSVGLLYLLLDEIWPQLHTENGDGHAALLARAVHYMRDHLLCKIGDVARYCGMSESGFYAFFRERAGCTPVDMKNRLKVERAIELLTATDRSVEEISAQLGFCSAAYFRKVIKAKTGKSPTELRREQYKNEGV